MEQRLPVNILIVDDHPENLLSLEAILESLGEKLVRATSGREALRFLLDHEFAVILLDVQMPGMDGFETASLIRHREKSQHTPIIFLTAIDKSESHVFKGYSVGAVDYIFKPFEPEILKAKVAVFIDLFRKTRELQLQSELLKRTNRELGKANKAMGSMNEEIRQLNEMLEARVAQRTEELRLANAELENEVKARKEAEEEVRKLNAGLEQRVRERTAELEAANRELESFSYSISHDLRTPLRSIDGFSKALLDDYFDLLDDSGKDYLKRVRGASQRMGELIDDILNLSRVTRNEMSRDEVNMSRIATKIAGDLKSASPDRQVDIRIHDGMVVQGDPRLLQVALQNLFDNAWKFTGRRENACIEFGVTENEGKQLYFVRDNGAGFDMRYAQKLFSPFQRLHSPDEFPGTGIGLATVQRVIKRHGGNIWTEAAVDRGATFYFTF